MARLLANLPALRTGLPPIVITNEPEGEYIGLLAGYELATGQTKPGTPLLGSHKLHGFQFSLFSWGKSTHRAVERIGDLGYRRSQPENLESATLRYFITQWPPHRTYH